MPGAGDAVDFEVVDGPLGVEVGDGIVIRLGGFVVFEAVVVGVPLTGVGGVGSVCRGEVRARDAEVVGDGFAGDSVDDVDTELEALGVDPVGERAEAFAVGGGGEAANGGEVEADMV
jgi:hypothetical protein